VCKIAACRCDKPDKRLELRPIRSSISNLATKLRLQSSVAIGLLAFEKGHLHYRRDRRYSLAHTAEGPERGGSTRYRMVGHLIEAPALVLTNPKAALRRTVLTSL
jgi:hypothetical protein